MREPIERLREDRPVPGAFPATFGPQLQLAQQERSLQFGHAIISAQDLAFVLVRNAGPSTVNERLQGFIAVEAVGQNKAAFAGGHQLAFLETKAAGITGGPRAAPLECSPMRVRAVFDD